MKRPAGSHFALIACALVACWRDRGGDTEPVRNQHEAALDLTGAYWCSITDSGYTYPAFPCAIRNFAGRFVLAKLGGSQRFHGEVKPVGKGFSFAGEFYCPWGDCSQALHGLFKPMKGGLRGTFSDARFVVTMTPAPSDAFGGVEYGGDGYGGFGDGAYGGDSYGGHPDRSGRRNSRPR
jgi:hypothetical protein